MGDALNQSNQTTISRGSPVVVGLSVSTANEFRIAAEARRQAAAALESIPTDTIARIARAQERQVAALAPMFDLVNSQLFADMRKTMQLYNSTFQSIILPYQQMAESMQAWQKTLASSITSPLRQSVITSLAININFELPRVYIPSALEEALIETSPDQPALAENNLLSVVIDQFGSFVIGGQRIVRANANSSRHGKLLSMLEDNKGQMVSRDDIKSQIKVTDATQVMKDLKKELRQLGYRLDYEPYRYQGLVYHGIVHRQQ